MKLKTLFFIPVLLVLTQCGLQEYPYLVEPVVTETLPGDYYFQFANTPQNAANPNVFFLGFELYYRLFTADSQGETAIDADRDKLDAYTFPTITDLTNLGYRRVYANGSDALPLIFIYPSDRSLAFSITIDFNNTLADYPEITWTDSGTVSPLTSLRRRLYVSAENRYVYKSFMQSDMLTTDEDVPDSASLSVYIACYVLTYGGSINSYSNLYSKPVYLGYTDLLITN